MKIYAIVGMPGSGKSVISEYLLNKGYPKIRFGEMIVQEIEKRGWNLTPQNEQIVREEIRKEHGMDALAKLALPWIKSALESGNEVIIDGLYSFSEYKTLKAEFGDDLIVIAVFTPKRTRYERLAHRKERPLSFQEAETRDYMEIERIEKGGPIALADFTILNDGSPDSLTRKAEELLDTIRSLG